MKKEEITLKQLLKNLPEALLGLAGREALIASWIFTMITGPLVLLIALTIFFVITGD